MQPFLQPAENVVGSLWERIERPGRGILHGLATAPKGDFGSFFQSIKQSLGGQQFDPNTDASALVQRIKQIVPWLPNDVVTRFAVQMLTDPVNLGGAPGKAGIEAAETRLGPKVAQTWHDLNIPPKSALGRVGNVAALAHQGLSVDGLLKQKLFKAFGPSWREHYDILGGARAFQGSVENEVTARFETRLMKTISGLTPEQLRSVLKGVNFKTYYAKLPADLRKRADAIKNLTDSAQHLEGTAGVQASLAKAKFTPPSFIKSFQSQTPRGILGESQYRERYLPIPHELQPMRKPAIHMSGLDPTDPHGFARKNIPASAFDTNDPHMFVDALRGRFASAAKSIANHDTLVRLRKAYGVEGKGKLPSVIQEAFDKVIVPEEHRDWYDKFMGATGNLGGDVMRTGMFATGFPHGKNVLINALLHDPIAAMKGVGKFAKTAFMDPEKRWEFHKPGIEAGAVQPAIRGERGSATANLFGKVGEALKPENTMGKVSPPQMFGMRRLGGLEPTEVRVLQGLGKPFEIAGKYYKFVADKLWEFDNSLNASAFEADVARGLSPERAAGRVRAHHVDYNTQSELTKKLKGLAWFATWATKSPMAVGRSVIENPALANAASKAYPELFGTPTSIPGEQKPEGSTTPTSEFAEALSGPHGWATRFRGIANPPLKVGLNTLYNEITNKKQGQYGWNPMTYGQPAGQFMQQDIPIYGVAKQLMGQGPFTKKGATGKEKAKAAAQEWLYQFTGLHPTSRTKGAKPMPRSGVQLQPSATPTPGSDWTPVNP